jgi:hypothetical protein
MSHMFENSISITKTITTPRAVGKETETPKLKPLINNRVKIRIKDN